MSLEESRRLISSLFALQRFYLAFAVAAREYFSPLFLLRRYFPRPSWRSAQSEGSSYRSARDLTSSPVCESLVRRPRRVVWSFSGFFYASLRSLFFVCFFPSFLSSNWVQRSSKPRPALPKISPITRWAPASNEAISLCKLSNEAHSTLIFFSFLSVSVLVKGGAQPSSCALFLLRFLFLLFFFFSS